MTDDMKSRIDVHLKEDPDDSILDNLDDTKAGAAFQHNSERNLIIANVLGKRGFFLLPSVHAFDKFKQTKFDFPRLEPEGVGIPLFQIVRSNKMWAGLSTKIPVYSIHKYIITRTGQDNPFSESEMVKCDSELTLWKAPYCHIHRRSGFKNIEFKLVFASDSSPIRELFMVRRSYDRDLFTCMKLTNLRWHVSCSPFKDNQHTLAILGEDFPSLLDDPGTRARKKQAKGNKQDLRIIGKYTTRTMDILPHRVSNEACVILGEWSDAPSYGISSISWETEVLACQGLLIHYMEYERRQGQEGM